MIRRIKTFLELVSDVLKEVLMQKADMSRDEVNALIIRKTIGKCTFWYFIN